MEVITVCSRKGGCGKTTTASALSSYLVRHDKSVLMVDLDSQSNLSSMYEPEEGYNATLYDVIVGGCTTSDAIYECVEGSILPSDSRLSTKDILSNKNNLNRLRRALRGTEYDAVIIDTPPGLGDEFTIEGLFLANWVLIPAKADKFSVESIWQTMETVNAVKKANHPLDVLGVIVTMYNGRTEVGRLMLDKLQEACEHQGITMIEPPIRRAMSAVDEMQLGYSIFDTKSVAGSDYDEVCGQITKKIWEA